MFEDDIFVEEMVVRRKTPLNLLLTVLMILGGAALIILVWLAVPFISTVLMVIIGFAVYLGVKFQYVEYEYSFTNGDLDVDGKDWDDYVARIDGMNIDGLTEIIQTAYDRAHE